MKQVILLSLLFAFTFAVAPLYLAKENKVEGSYIVVFKETVPSETVSMHRLSLLKMDPSNKIQFIYNYTLNGFSGTFTQETINYLLNSEHVEFVEEDQIMSIADSEACVSQTGATWGLGRLPVQLPSANTNTWRYESTANGAGVRSFVIDTGILTSHNQFGGRATWGVNYAGGSNTDGNGHGTHVAGTIAGSTYGVAKGASVVAVKVLSDSGSGTTAAIVSGIDWVGGTGTANRDTANLSLGGGASTALDNAVNTLVSRGIFTAIAAGNSNANACNYSPARATSPVTVGSISQPASGSQDPRSSFSNYGTCVDIFAPGEAINSAWIGSNTATRTISGTSMASPHVAGVASLILSGQSQTPASVKTRLINGAVTGTISNAGTGSPNRVLHSTC